MDTKQKRLAKNTILLYGRTLITMCITLYTSRLVLEMLGVDDFGIYNVVGGLVVMLSVLTSSLMTAINRFISYELGLKSSDRLNLIFNTSLNVQIIISIVIILLGETVGTWFLNHYMVIPHDRMVAANWVFQCSIFTFVLNLISIPYSASIIAHEKMAAYAYICIFEAVIRLCAILLLLYSSYADKLIAYALLQLGVAGIIRLIYGIYCNKSFSECKYRLIIDSSLLKEMLRFAGWNLFSNCSYVFNTQGVNILINIFFGVALNAARGIAVQVENAIMNFVNSFTTAINPQIIKAYSSGDESYLTKLVIDGAKYSFFMTIAFVLPILLDTSYILKLWLKDVPLFAVIFVQLSFIYTVINTMGNTGYFACVAHGDMKYYSLHLTTISILVFPLTWLSYRFGLPVETCYLINGGIALICFFVRLNILKKFIGLNPFLFLKRMFLPAILITMCSIIPPYILKENMNPGLLRLGMIVVVSEASLALCIYMFGLQKTERHYVKNQAKRLIKFKN